MSMVTEYKEEKKKISPLAQWIKDEAITGFKTKDEIEAEKAMAETSKADYYKSLNAVKAVRDGERQGILDSYDNFFTNNYTTIANLSQGRFLGYAFLSYLAQDAFIRRAVTTRADEMTRAWGELTGEDKEKSTEEKINFVTSELERVETKNIFRKASNLTGYFGGCLAYIDMRSNPNEPLSDEELATPLYKVGQDDFNKAKLKGLKLVGLQPIEPINIAPSTYNSTDPTAKNFYEPEYFYILGRKIHKSRFLYFAENIPPQILKPVYLFFGIPLAQIMFPYVQAFYKSKDVVNNVVLKFSCTSISTDIDGLIAVDGENAVLNRINTIAKYRDNNSVIVLDKNTEDMQQINTPISGLREILYANLELLPVISGIPTTKFLETSPTGLNATGEYDMRNFYDLINTLQNNTFNEPINKLIDIICYSNGLDSNGLTWTWKPLYQMSDREKAEVNQMKANTSNIYVQMGAITNADVARQLMNDKDSEYESLEIPEPIDINEQEEEVDMQENGEDTEIDKILKDGVEDEDFKESDHPQDTQKKIKEEIKEKAPSLWQKLKGLLDADRWITIHPPHGNKEDTGIPLKIGEDGEIKAGAGGKFTGKKINTIKKQRNDTSTPSENKEKSTTNADAEKVASLNKEIDQAYKDYENAFKDYAKNTNQFTVRDFYQKMSEKKQIWLKKREEKSGVLKEMAAKRSENIKQNIANYKKNTEGMVSSLSSIDDSFVREIENKRKSYLDAKNADTMTRFKLFSDYADTKKASKGKLLDMAHAIANSLKKGYKSNFNVTAEKVTPKAKKAFDTAKQLLDGFFSDNIKKGDLAVKARGRIRANCGENEIHLASDDDFDVMIHEYGHYLERNNPNMLLNSMAFLQYRTQGEDLRSLKLLTGSRYYSYKEKAKADNFFSPYCGKFYDDATEIMSMGLQRLFTDAKKFAEEDREYFDFVIANARGEL